MEFLNTPSFGVSLSLLAYGLGVVLQKRFRLALFNPLLSLSSSRSLARHRAYRLRGVLRRGEVPQLPAHAGDRGLAVPLYEIRAAAQRWRAILAGILSGVLTTLCSVLALSLAFRLSHEEYVTLLPKSIKTAIGMGVSEGARRLCDADRRHDHHYRHPRQRHRRRRLPRVPHHRADRQGRSHRLRRARTRHGKGHRDWRGGGR